MKNYFRSLLIFAFLLLLAGCTGSAGKKEVLSFNCDQIKDVAIKTRCTEDLQATVNGYLEAQATGKRTLTQEIDIIVESGDSKGCDKLPDDDSRAFCRNQFSLEPKELTPEEKAQELRDRKPQPPQE